MFDGGLRRRTRGRVQRSERTVIPASCWSLHPRPTTHKGIPHNDHIHLEQSRRAPSQRRPALRRRTIYSNARSGVCTLLRHGQPPLCRQSSRPDSCPRRTSSVIKVLAERGVENAFPIHRHTSGIVCRAMCSAAQPAVARPSPRPTVGCATRSSVVAPVCQPRALISSPRASGQPVLTS